MPDKVPPAKMPSMFPIPTHVVRRRIVKSINVGVYPKLIWCPEYVYGQGVLVGKRFETNNDGILKNEATADLATGAIKIDKLPLAWLNTIQPQWTPPTGSSVTTATNLSYVWDNT